MWTREASLRFLNEHCQCYQMIVVDVCWTPQARHVRIAATPQSKSPVLTTATLFIIVLAFLAITHVFVEHTHARARTNTRAHAKHSMRCEALH